MMGRRQVGNILRKLNKEWGLGFISTTMGSCCHSCAEFETEEKTKQFYEADTHLIISWFFRGMNYNGKFDEQDVLYINYDLGDKVSIEKVCSDLKEQLGSAYAVIVPKDDSECIKLESLAM